MTPHASLEFLPTVEEIATVFRDEIASVGGTITDVFETPDLVIARAVLAADGEVRPGDVVRGGVALRARDEEVLVSPYTFRQVCSNGAIAAQALETRRIERVRAEGALSPSYEASLVTAAIGEAVRASAAPQAFAAVVTEMRSAAEVEADVALQLLPFLTQLPAHDAARIAAQVFRRFGAQPDRSLFGLRNAVTSLARDTRDAELRWRLEELGGTMGARLVVAPKVGAPAAAVVRA